MRYRSLIPGMLGDSPFVAGDILELSDEDAITWVQQMCLIQCDDQSVEPTVSGEGRPTQPPPQHPPDEAPEAPQEEPEAPPAPLPEPEPEPEPAPLEDEEE